MVQCYAPELNKRCRRELKPTKRSWRVDETYIRVKGKWTYLYRAVDSAGATIDFLLAARRDAAAKRFFQNALLARGHPRPRVINVDGNPSYPKVVAELKQEGKLSSRCRCRTCAWRINRIKRLSEFGTSLGSASATSTNRDQLVIPFLPQAVRAGALPAPHAFDGRYSNVENRLASPPDRL
jgi:transposase-like protein